MIRSIYKKLSRYKYLAGKLKLSSRKKLIIYTKQHPIFSSAFEDASFPDHVFAFVNFNQPGFSFLEKKLIDKADLIHADATSFPTPLTGKKFIVECEGKPDDSFFTDNRIKKILVESKSAGVHYLGSNNMVQVSYPCMTAQAPVDRSNRPAVTILCVGHGGLLKSYDVVYRLYKTLSAEMNIKLIIAGSFGHNYQWYPEITEATYNRIGFDDIQKELLADKNVTFRAFKREELLANIYKEADIYVHLSRMETFGYSILEAMSFSLPVVSCVFKAIPEMVEHGNNGFLVSSNIYNADTRDYDVNINSTEWADNCYNEALGYIRKLAQDPALRHKMGARSAAVVEERFSVREKVSSLSKLYNEVAGK